MRISEGEEMIKDSLGLVIAIMVIFTLLPTVFMNNTDWMIYCGLYTNVCAILYAWDSSL